MKRMVIVLGGMVIAAGLILVLMTFQPMRTSSSPAIWRPISFWSAPSRAVASPTLTVEEGDSVKQGDPIFVLESSEQEASVAAARSRVQEAEARLADVKAEIQRPDEIKVLGGRAQRGASHAAGGEQQSRACAVVVRQRLDHQGAA